MSELRGVTACSLSPPRFSGQTGSVFGPLMAAEEADGAGLRAGFSPGHDGGPEAAGPGSEPGRRRRGRLPLPADPGASAAGSGAAGPQQNTGEKQHSQFKYTTKNLKT